jgi:hypothetical protein
MRSRQSNNIPSPQQTSKTVVFFLTLDMKSISVKLCSTASCNFNKFPKPDAYSLSHICFLALIVLIFHLCEIAPKLFCISFPSRPKPSSTSAQPQSEPSLFMSIRVSYRRKDNFSHRGFMERAMGIEPSRDSRYVAEIIGYSCELPSKTVHNRVTDAKKTRQISSNSW